MSRFRQGGFSGDMDNRDEFAMVGLPDEAGREREVDVVVVGGGQAGISTSFHLKNRQVSHVVLERDRPFSSWVNRWDGFRTNTPNWMNTLPMLPSRDYPSGDPSAFATREELLDYLGRCLAAVEPPIQSGCEVRRVVQLESGNWHVETNEGILKAGSVVICNGAMSTPRLPDAQAEIDPGVVQIHSSEYRNPDQIASRRVLVVGSASSGVQICRLLGEAGKFDEIAMSVSKVMTLPGRILGIQTHRFLHGLGLFDVRSGSFLGRFMYSGLETKGDPIMRPAPKDLARLFGVDLYGRFAGVDSGVLTFADGRTMSTENLTIVWCTGFRGDYGFIEVEQPDRVFGPNGSPLHVRGQVEAAPGLYFVGLRYQHTVASHDIYGVGADAAFIADRIVERIDAGARNSTGEVS